MDPNKAGISGLRSDESKLLVCYECHIPYEPSECVRFGYNHDISICRHCINQAKELLEIDY